MTTFVPLTEDDQAYDLVMFLNRIKKDIVDMKEDGEDNVKAASEEGAERNLDIQAQLAEEALEQAKRSPLGELVKKKLPDLMQEFFNMADKIFACDEAVVDATCSLALSLFIKVATQASDVQNYVNKFSEVFVKDSSSKVELRLKLLSILFNLLDETSELRHGVLVAIFEYALKTKQASLLVSHLGHVETWAAQWKLANKDLAKVLKLSAEICQQAGVADDAQLFLFKYLKTASASANAPEDAATLVIAAMKYNTPKDGSCKPCYEYDSLRKLAGIQSLKDDAKYSGLFTILNTFASGTVPDFLAFTKANPKAVSGYGLDEETLIGKLRTLTLCSLGMKEERLKYSLLVQQLGLASSDEVEEVVIAAVRTGLLEAKIDQEQEEVVIQRTTPREFVQEDWATMHLKLQEWKKAVEGVMTTLTEVRNEQEHAVAEDEVIAGY